MLFTRNCNFFVKYIGQSNENAYLCNAKEFAAMQDVS